MGQGNRRTTQGIPYALVVILLDGSLLQTQNIVAFMLLADSQLISMLISLSLADVDVVNLAHVST